MEAGKYKNKFIVPWDTIPDKTPTVDKMENDDPWWPVGILKFQSGLERLTSCRVDGTLLYVICLWQALEEVMVAWTIPCTHKKMLHVASVHGTSKDPYTKPPKKAGDRRALAKARASLTPTLCPDGGLDAKYARILYNNPP